MIDMNTINKEKLRERLLQEGYIEANGLNGTIDRLVNLKGKALEMLVNWIDKGIIPEFEEIEGVDSTFLREQLEMKEPAIILSYGMLLNDPKDAAEKLKSLVTDRFDFYPNT